VTAADVAALLGAPDRSTLVLLFAALLGGDRAAVLKGCAELEATGADPRATLRDLTALVRGTVRLAADPSAPPPWDSRKKLRRGSRSSRRPPLMGRFSGCSRSSRTPTASPRSDLPALAFEVLLLKLAELPRLVPIEEFLSGKFLLPRSRTGRARRPTVEWGRPRCFLRKVRKEKARKTERAWRARAAPSLRRPLHLPRNPPACPSPPGRLRRSHLSRLVRGRPLPRHLKKQRNPRRLGSSA